MTTHGSNARAALEARLLHLPSRYMATSTSYEERPWGRSTPETERAKPSRVQRSFVLATAIAVAAVGALGYLGYVRATTPTLNAGVPAAPPVSSRLVQSQNLLVKLELGLAEPNEPRSTTTTESERE